jgi:acyl carrier protein
MFERLRELLAESYRVQVAAITRETPLNTLLRDSLDLVEFAMLCEEWEVDLPDETVANLDLMSLTVGELADLFERNGKSAP